MTGGDGKTYGKLDFSKYMEQFVSDRYVDFEIVTDEVRGLKIPRSSVTDVTFYVIPKDYYEWEERLFRHLDSLRAVSGRRHTRTERRWELSLRARSTTRMTNIITWTPGKTAN